MSDDEVSIGSSASSSSELAKESNDEGNNMSTITGLKSKFKILTLVDGILIEPLSSRDDGDDNDSATTGDEGTASITASIVGEMPPDEEEDEAKRGGTTISTWSCPGATSDGTTCNATGKDARCTHSSYDAKGKTDPSELEQSIGPDVDGGLVFTVKILPNDYNKKEKKLKFLQSKDYDPNISAPKPRRKMPFPITAADFFSSIVRVGKPSVEMHGEKGYDDLWDRDVRQSTTTGIKMESSKPPRWIFTGVINGWPGLSMPLEVRKIEGRETSFVGRRKGWSSLWDCERDGKEDGKDPSYSTKSSGEQDLQIKVKLRAPEWSAHGWSASSPGFIFWVEGQTVGLGNNAPLTVTYGTDLINHFKCPKEGDPLNTRVHMISHRYARGRTETNKEKLTYHSLVLLEWDHGQFVTVVEIGYLNGLGGYRGKSNWYDDSDSPEPRLYGAFPPEMVLPWKETMSEIRCHDVPYSNVDDFLGFMKKYEGNSGRFVDTRLTFSHDVRLTYRSRRNIATYLLNYIRRDRTYSEMRRNCQTMSADLCGFLAGKKDVAPFHPVNQIQYTCQKHKFLYESSGYQRSKS